MSSSLWETDYAEAPLRDRKYKSWPVTLVHKPHHLKLSSTIHALKTWLETFLTEFAKIYHGDALLGTQLPDEKFLQMLESALHLPIIFTQDELENRYKKPKLTADIDQWMRAKGWLIVDDPEGIRDNLERAAKSLSVNNTNFSPADYGRCQMMQGDITGISFLKANQELTGPVEP